MERTQKSGLATAGLVLGIIGIVLSFIPIINNVAFVLGALALIFGIIAVVKVSKVPGGRKGKAIAAIVLGAVTIVFVIMAQAIFSKVLDEATKDTTTKQSTESSQTEPTDKKKAWDVDAAYAKIEKGMTKSQVEQATDKSSESCTTSDSDLGNYETCVYGNAFIDKAAITVTYNDGKVDSKSKSTY